LGGALGCNSSSGGTTTGTFQITSFSGDTLVAANSYAWLHWTYTGNPTSLTLDGVSVLGLDMAPVNPVMRHTYTLTGTDGASTSTKTFTVAAQGLDVIAGADVLSGDGPVNRVGFANISSICTDPDGGIYTADWAEGTVRTIGLDGYVTTLAGSPFAMYCLYYDEAWSEYWDEGNTWWGMGAFNLVGPSATFAQPAGLARDAIGNLYVPDASLGTLQMVAPGGQVSSYAGTMFQFSNTTDGPPLTGTFGCIYGMCMDGFGNFFVVDMNISEAQDPWEWGQYIDDDVSRTGLRPAKVRNATWSTHGHRASTFRGRFLAKPSTSPMPMIGSSGTLRLVGPQGVITTLSGVTFTSPSGAICVDGSRNLLYYADSTNVYSVSLTYTDGVPAVNGGPTLVASSFSWPMALALDASGNLYVADSQQYQVFQILAPYNPSPAVNPFAGTSGTQGSLDGQGTAALFTQPMALAFDPQGNLLVGDFGQLRSITPGGKVTTIAGAVGIANLAYYGDNNPAPQDGTGINAVFGWLAGVCQDNAGNSYVVDNGGVLIRKVTPAGVVTTFAGGDTFTNPSGICTDGTNYLWVTDASTNQVVQLSLGSGGPNPTPLTLQGATSFGGLKGICRDSSGNLYVADASGYAVYQLVPPSTAGGAWTSTAIAGTPGSQASADDDLSTLWGPTAICIDPSTGNLFLMDACEVREILYTPPASWALTVSLAGTATSNGWVDGPGSSAQFSAAQGITLDGSGDLFVADSDNYAVRRLTPVTDSPRTYTVTTLVAQSFWYNIGLDWDYVYANSRGILADQSLLGYTNQSPAYGQVDYPQGICGNANGDLVLTSGAELMQITAPGMGTTFQYPPGP
jgi:sugar lactone lactonase YvrE